MTEFYPVVQVAYFVTDEAPPPDLLGLYRLQSVQVEVISPAPGE